MSDSKKDNRNPLFRGLKSLTGNFTPFEIDHLPEKPGELFIRWFEQALQERVPEPHAVTLSTVDHEGRPDARMLILKDVHGESFYFASSMESRKGLQLEQNPYAAITFYWHTLGRQIRLRGTATETGSIEGAEDFRRRPAEARAVAMIGRQSKVLESQQELEHVLDEQRQYLQEHPDAAAPLWRLYALKIDEAEFWQADSGRKHTRVQYRLNKDGRWEQQLLYP
ncbi:pyridoxal 5'-phosphate synthase [Saccharibacillus sp. JS10]|uniref:pyridoxine/pyridoxamine 5'-phosphate oxidase n=1 Tax=Saccharibacillus sp. JS10 TaxID=2950552 RepID=UPI002109C042|nr:pyridoxal 5'-phosphate synthase [Saccharibacillus sp. JS10]MCQ4085529.1 pyridoxal 5'-phosphate synthase [Saccharibacillus sp. JS10]